MSESMDIRDLEKVLQQALDDHQTITETVKNFHERSGLSTQNINVEHKFSPLVKEKIRAISDATGIPLPVLQYYFFGMSWNYV